MVSDMMRNSDYRKKPYKREENGEWINLQKKPVIYTAYSKHYFFARMLISSYVLNKNVIPLNPFNN